MVSGLYTKGIAVLACLVVFLFSPVVTAGSDWDVTDADISILDKSADHVHREGAPFSLKIAVSPKVGGAVYYQWKEANGAVLSPSIALPAKGEAVSITSPSGERGYYGLVLTPDARTKLPNRQQGEAREYGFVIVPDKDFAYASTSRFGTVHTDLKDSNLPPWTKTMTWMTAPAHDWSSRMNNVRRYGKIELPIIVEGEWTSEDDRPVPKAQLEKIKQKSKDYFLADRATHYWEAGLEENLKENFNKPYYWQNLQNKMQALRDAAMEAKADIRFIYQIASRDAESTRVFLGSEASKDFDILSLHPYAWPAFDSPDNSWLENLLLNTKQIMKANKKNLPIWFTEVGAPSFGNYVGGFFGYPSLNRPTGGLSRIEMASYLAKVCVISVANGVERIFWYNYQDAGSARDSVEMHFGLKDYLGYPKPAYAAYIHAARVLDGLNPVMRSGRIGGVKVFEFSDNQKRVFAVWAEKGGATLPLSSLNLRAALNKTIQITDVVGQTIEAKNDQIILGNSPYYIEISSPGLVR